MPSQVREAEAVEEAVAEEMEIMAAAEETAEEMGTELYVTTVDIMDTCRTNADRKQQEDHAPTKAMEEEMDMDREEEARTEQAMYKKPTKIRVTTQTVNKDSNWLYLHQEAYPQRKPTACKLLRIALSSKTNSRIFGNRKD